MTTVLSKKWRVEIPEEVRKELKLAPGDDFEVSVEDEDTITLHRVTHPPDAELAEWFLDCPGPLEIPERQKDYTKPLSL